MVSRDLADALHPIGNNQLCPTFFQLFTERFSSRGDSAHNLTASGQAAALGNVQTNASESVFEFRRARVRDEYVQKYADQVAENAAGSGASNHGGNGAETHQVADGRSGRKSYYSERQAQKQSFSHRYTPILIATAL